MKDPFPESCPVVEYGLFRGRGAVEAGRMELLERRDGGPVKKPQPEPVLCRGQQGQIL